MKRRSFLKVSGAFLASLAMPRVSLGAPKEGIGCQALQLPDGALPYVAAGIGASYVLDENQEVIESTDRRVLAPFFEVESHADQPLTAIKWDCEKAVRDLRRDLLEGFTTALRERQETLRRVAREYRCNQITWLVRTAPTVLSADNPMNRTIGLVAFMNTAAVVQRVRDPQGVWAFDFEKGPEAPELGLPTGIERMRTCGARRQDALDLQGGLRDHLGLNIVRPAAPWRAAA